MTQRLNEFGGIGRVTARSRTLEVACPHCLRRRGFACTTRTGKRAKQPHAERVEKSQWPTEGQNEN